MAKLFLVLCCLSAGCVLWAEANPFFFNIQKSYVAQPAQSNSQTRVTQSTDFGLGGIVSKWLAFSQIFADKLLGPTTQRPRPTQRPVIQIDPVYVPVDLEKEEGSKSTTEVPADKIETSTRRKLTSTTSGYTPDDTSTTSSYEYSTTSTTDRTSSTRDYEYTRPSTTDRTTTHKYTTPSTTDRTSSTSDYEYTRPSTTDRTTTYEYTTPSTTDRTSSTTDYEYTRPSTTDRTTTYEYTTPSTTDRTTTTISYEYTTPSTTDRTTTTTDYEYTHPSTTDRTTTSVTYEYTRPSTTTTIRPTTYRPTTQRTTTTTTEPDKEIENEIYTGEEDKSEQIIKSTTTSTTTQGPFEGEEGAEGEPSRTYLPPVQNRFSVDTESFNANNFNPSDLGAAQASFNADDSTEGINPRVYYYF